MDVSILISFFLNVVWVFHFNCPQNQTADEESLSVDHTDFARYFAARCLTVPPRPSQAPLP